MEKEQNKRMEVMKKQNKGITLIALVITIIVLLILAGVTIATLTGDNGLLQKAQIASEKSTDAEIDEEIRLAWNKVYSDIYLDSTIDKAKALAGELGIEETAVNLNGNKIGINYRGKYKVLDVSNGTLIDQITIEKAKEDGIIFDDNTSITDSYGNKFIVPKGFKLASDSAENVTEGIVIEDATYTNTKGSQFVWIPVSRDATEANKVKGTKNTTILLSRYTFNSSGTPTNVGANTISSHYAELASSSYGNAVAKTDINSTNGFIEKTNNAGGFWIGRYEARIEGYTGDVVTSNSNNEPNWTGYTGGKLVEKPDAQVFAYITQNKASELSRKMYDKENDGITTITKFESDLMNSYAWDTATLFLQEYDNRISKSKVYSIQNSINTGTLANGTVTETNKDIICNVYDMASNCWEWITETYNDSGEPCVHRGGLYCDIYRYTSTRDKYSVSTADGGTTFRPLLFIK